MACKYHYEVFNENSGGSTHFSVCEMCNTGMLITLNRADAHYNCTVEETDGQCNECYDAERRKEPRDVI